MDWHFETYSGRIPKNTLPIARDSCGNLWLLSVRGDDAGSVFFWEHGSCETFDETDLGNWPKVATSFQEFRDSLGTIDEATADDAVLSRYSLVNQAAKGAAKNDSSFSTRGNPDAVWHCDCDDEGHVKMELVQYEIHAVTTHTCGYSRLLAFKGLVKRGEGRLP
jgi:hypothetical protein